MKKILLISLILMLMNACYARQQQALRDDAFTPLTFNSDEKVAVMLTDDGSHTFVYKTFSADKSRKPTEKTKVYLGSGIVVANKTQAALLGVFSQVQLLSTKNKEQAISLCKQQNVKFLVVPTILHWEDRNTPYSGSADKIEVKIDVFDIMRNKTVNSIVFQAHNEWATLTDQPPEDLLDGEFNKAIADMFSAGK